MIAALDLVLHGPALSVGLCLLGVVGIVLARRAPNVREGVSLATAVANFVLVLWMYRRFEAGATLGTDLLTIVPGVTIGFRVDGLGMLFALVASGLWIVNTLYSIGYMRAHHEHKQTRFYACFSIAISACMGAAFSANLFSLFAFYELLTICTYPLVVHAETDEAKAGARRYVTYLLGASIAFLLPALMIVWSAAGTLSFAQLPAALDASDASPAVLSLAFLLFLAGMAKCGIMPFHAWLPAAMVAPTPVSALLHAVAVVKMGVFGVSRVVLDVFGTDLLAELSLDDVLVAGACVTIVLGSLIALAQDNLKRRLAYSTISQLSYVLLGLGLLVGVAGEDHVIRQQASLGGVMHVGIHAWSKITLFFAAGAIYVALHKTQVSELDGIGRRMPITMTAFTVGAFSMIGLPPAAGILSKWWLVDSAAAGAHVGVLLVLGASALLNAAYFLPIVWRAFFKPLPEGASTGWKEAPWPCVVALAVTAAGTVALFFFPGPLEELARQIVGRHAP